MSADATHSEVERALSDVLQPARDLETKLAARQAELRAEQESVLEQLRRVRAVLRAADPAGRPGTAKGTKKGGAAKAAATPEEIDALRAFALANREIFNANGGLDMQGMRNAGLTGVASKWLSSAVDTLHEEGFFVLDHKGRGGARYFKVAVDG